MPTDPKGKAFITSVIEMKFIEKKVSDKNGTCSNSYVLDIDGICFWQFALTIEVKKFQHS